MHTKFLFIHNQYSFRFYFLSFVFTCQKCFFQLFLTLMNIQNYFVKIYQTHIHEISNNKTKQSLINFS